MISHQLERQMKDNTAGGKESPKPLNPLDRKACGARWVLAPAVPGLAFEALRGPAVAGLTPGQ